jgi:hypothetical protein
MVATKSGKMSRATASSFQLSTNYQPIVNQESLMGNQRVSNQVLSDDLAKKLRYTCCVCGKKCEGFYGAHAEIGGTCSGACERVQAAKPKYGEHTEEAFLKRFNLE